MNQLTLLSTVVFVGLVAITTAESSLARSASGVFRLRDNKNVFLKPIVHTKEGSPLVRSGVRMVRSGIVDNSRKRISRRTRSGDQIPLESIAHPGISNDGFVNSSSEEEPEIVGFVSDSEEWLDEGVQTHQTQPSMQYSSPQRSTNSLFDRVVKENDMGVTFRYVQPWFTGDKTPSYYNHEETDEAARHNHVRLLYDGPYSYSPHSGHTRYFMQYRHGDEGADNYLPYFRFAPSVQPQIEKETTHFESPHNPVPISYAPRWTHLEQRADLQGRMLMSGQPTDFLPSIRTESGLQGRSREMELGSAGSNEVDMKHMRELEGHGSTKEGANFGVEDVRYAEDSVEGQDSVEMEEESEVPAVSWYPVLMSAA
jgi:hypothetical protein